METSIATKTWKIDPMHSEVQFKVKHLVISTVSGYFKQFEGEIQTEKEDFSDAKSQFTAQVNSISTNNEDRDNHLKSDDFFGADQFPTLTFRSGNFKKLDATSYEIIGEITIKGVTRIINLHAEFGGIMTDPYGQTKVGFEITGKINRQDFGLRWNAITETGGIVVSDEVKLSANLQFILS